MTEDEATVRWCPFSRFYVSADEDIESTSALFGNAYRNNAYIASKCMAWRWNGETESPDKERSANGYCGLAGKP